jgi:hypothetical protein
MTTDVEIYNNALVELGDENRISSIGEAGRNGQVAETVYTFTRDALLASHPWNFAMARSTLTADTTDPDFEFDNQYHLPGDYLRALALYNTNNRFKVEGDKLLTNASPADLIYIKKETNVGKFSPLFSHALSLLIAAKISESITGSTSKKQALEGKANRVLKEARKRDGQEGTSDPLIADLYTRFKTSHTPYQR